MIVPGIGVWVILVGDYLGCNGRPSSDSGRLHWMMMLFQ